jgi:hypothetical protein
MNKNQAIREMLNGKPVSHNTWLDGVYIFYSEGHFLDEDNETIQINRYPDDGWGVYLAKEKESEDYLPELVGELPLKLKPDELADFLFIRQEQIIRYLKKIT